MFGRNLLSTRAREPFEPSKDVENLSSFDYEMLGSFRLAVFCGLHHNWGRIGVFG